MSAGSPLDHPQEAAPAPWHFIELDELQERVAAHHGRCIDARAPAFYQAGHIPGALNVPRESFERGYAKIRPLLESAKETPVIVYCSDADCPDGELVAGGLSHLGYRQLFVYKEGWEEWMRAGLPRDVGQGL